MNEQPEKTPGGGPRWNNPALSFGIQFAVAVAILSLLGRKMDNERGTGVFWTSWGAGLGLAYGAYELWKLTRSRPHGDDRK